jgi:hypothetical protein
MNRMYSITAGMHCWLTISEDRERLRMIQEQMNGMEQVERGRNGFIIESRIIYHPIFPRSVITVGTSLLR